MGFERVFSLGNRARKDIVNFAAQRRFVPLIVWIGRKPPMRFSPAGIEHMATDPTFNETESALEEPRDEAGPMRTPNPPRPPRPVKRSKGSGRIPMPLPPSRPGFVAAEPEANLETLEEESLADAAPRVAIDDEREEPAIPLLPSRAKPHSGRPEESFADLDAELSDRAPAAPVTPWRGIPALQADPVDATPPRASPIELSRAFEVVDREDEHEPTMVGKVPVNLLELSSSGDENTRAFTAPRELIELAKRKREEGRAAKAPAGSAAPPADLSLAAPAVPIEEKEAPAAPAPVARAESLRPPSVDEDAAPPVARSFSGEMEAVALPSRRTPESEAPPASGPDIEVGPGSDVSDSNPTKSSAAPSPASTAAPSSVPNAPYKRWLLMVGLFVLVGVVIARWREMAVWFR